MNSIRVRPMLFRNRLISLQFLYSKGYSAGFFHLLSSVRVVFDSVTCGLQHSFSSHLRLRLFTFDIKSLSCSIYLLMIVLDQLKERGRERSPRMFEKHTLFAHNSGSVAGGLVAYGGDRKSVFLVK